MKRLPFALLSLVLAFHSGVVAKDAPAPPTPAPYFDAKTLDARALLPNPPADDSAVTEKEIELILQRQASRTEQELARIKLEEHYNVYVFGNVVGAWFTPQNESTYPLTANLLQRVAETAKPIVAAAKGDWKRPRPFLINSRIIPPIDRPKDAAYPSGHSTRGYLDALVLSALMPDGQNILMARGAQIGDDRVSAGVHYPSDVDAGRKLALAIFQKLQSSPGFADELKTAKAEVTEIRKKQ